MPTALARGHGMRGIDDRRLAGPALDAAVQGLPGLPAVPSGHREDGVIAEAQHDPNARLFQDAAEMKRRALLDGLQRKRRATTARTANRLGKENALRNHLV